MQFFQRSYKAKEIPSLTNWLVKNQWVRNMVLTFHREKTETINEVDKYLEKQLLNKDELDKKNNTKRIDGNNRQ